MKLVELELRSCAEDAIEAVTVTQYGDSDGLYCCAITRMQDGQRVALKNGRQTYTTGKIDKALAWWHEASGGVNG